MSSQLVDIPTLKTELLTDPGHLGYSGKIFIGDQQGITELLNTVMSGTAFDGKSYVVNRDDIQPREIINAIQTVDFNAAQQIQISKLQMLFQGAPIDATLPNVKANFQAVFAGASPATVSGLAAIASRNGTRAEVLFGTSTTITLSQVAAALHS